MRIEEIASTGGVRKVIYADEGMIATNGVNYGSIITLAEGVDVDGYYEITEEEYNALFNTDESESATDEDYQNALKEFGVQI